MGEVYLAHDSQLGRKVAIKLLPVVAGPDSQARKRLFREAQTAATLDHPNICSIYEIGETEERSFIVMQYVEGETLSDLLKRERLSLHESLKIAVQVTDALAEAHARHIIHRDIKPSNIIITPRRDAKVLDFGLAKVVSKDQQINSQAQTQGLLSVRGVVIGTVPYMSPEQVRGLPLDARTDIFSFGVVLYEVLSGSHPFICESGAETISAILTNQPPPLLTRSPDAPQVLQSIVEKCLAKDKAQRYQTMGEVHDDLLAAQRAHESRNAGANEALFEARTVPLAPRATKGSRTSWQGKFAMPRGALIVAGLALALFIAAAVVYSLRTRPTATSPTPISSLAVLPFTNVNADPELDYLCDGLTESVINRLSQLPNLKVMSRNSVLRYKGKDIDTRDVGQHLEVQSVLTGRVSQHGDMLSIILELIDARDGTHLWGAPYDRKLSDLVTVQREIPVEVADNLRIRLSGEERQHLTKRYTDNADAYRLYLKGRYFWDKRTREGIEKATESFRQAIDLDPNYALAHAGLADCYLFNKSGLSPVETIPKAKAAAVKALELDDTLAEAHTTLGFIKQRYEYDWAGGEQSFKRALELNPNYPIAHQFYGGMLMFTGHTEEGLREAHRALELDPLSSALNWYWGFMLYFARRYDEAMRQMQQTLQLHPDSSLAQGGLGRVYVAKGMYKEAIEQFNKLGEHFDGVYESKPLLAHAYATSGKRAEAERLLRESKKESEHSYVAADQIARIYVGLGRDEEALVWLERGYDERANGMIFLKVDPAFDPLRSNIRFTDLLRRIGLA